MSNVLKHLEYYLMAGRMNSTLHIHRIYPGL